MLNKKLLAVAVTAAMTAGFANANPSQLAVDLDVLKQGNGADYPNSVVVSYVDELTWGADTAIVQNSDGTPSYMTANIGFTIAEGTNKYIRIDLTRADGDDDEDTDQPTFQSVPRLRWDTVNNDSGNPTLAARMDDANNTGNIDSDSRATGFNGLPNPQSSIAEGGVGESYVVFEVNAFEAQPTIIEDIPSFLSFYVEVDDYSLPTDVVTEARYRLYEDAIDAQRANAETLKDTSTLTPTGEVISNVELAKFVSGVEDEFTVPNSAYASVDTEYTQFIWSGSEFADHDQTDFYDAAMLFTSSNRNSGGFDDASNWGGAAVTATTASVGVVNTELLVDETNELTDLDGGEFTHVDVVGTNPELEFFGDFSYGTWRLWPVDSDLDNANASCGSGTEIAPDPTSTNSKLVFNNPEITQTMIENDMYVLCVNVENMTSDTDDNLLVGDENPWVLAGNVKNRIQESDYRAELSWDTVEESDINSGDGWDALDGADAIPVKDEMGSIIYSSITVDVPFMSTFTDYKQRFHLTNNGPTDATYMFEFTPEVGTTVTPNPAVATGVIPAGASIVVQTADIIASFDGRSRTAALLHIGGEDEDIGVSAVITNPEKGTIDIQDLNANSIKARKSNKLPEANGVN